jgi:hypothetical protein
MVANLTSARLWQTVLHPGLSEVAPLSPPWICHRWAQSSKQVPGAGQQVQVGESFTAFLTRQAYGKYQPQRQAYGKPRLDGQERKADSFAQPQDFTRGLPRSSFDGYARLARLVGPERVQVVSANRLWDENRTVKTPGYPGTYFFWP